MQRHGRLLWLLACAVSSGGAEAVWAQTCPDGTLWEPYAEVCAEVRDKQQEFLPQLFVFADAAKISIDQGTLLPERGAVTRKAVTPDDEDLPVPGSMIAGIYYQSNQLVALESGRLHTRMFVRPDGLQPDGPLPTFYTTATSRVNRGLELLVVYGDNWPNRGRLGLYAWPCLPDYPCPDGDTSPGWQWFRGLAELTCNITQGVDQGGHAQKFLYYANHTDKLDNGTPPQWRSAAYLWNYCDEAWDLAWEHVYRQDKVDCSIPGSGCAWWGPSFEIFGDDPYPQIAELGYEDSLLYHDGVWSELRPDEAGYTDPTSSAPRTPWQSFHIDPNRGYGAGNFIEVNEPPEIVGQSALSTVAGTSLTVTVDALDLIDPNIDPDYHHEFLLTIYDGDNYSIDGNTVIPDAGFEGTLEVPAQASDGWADSTIYELSVQVTAASHLVFQQAADGMLSIEAEHFDTRVAAAERSWRIVPDSAASGSAGIQSLPDDSRSVKTNIDTYSPRVGYVADIVSPGIHYVWFRARGVSYASNSFHFGIDGAVITDIGVTPVGDTWVWVGRIPIRLSLGQTTVNVWMREDGTEIDKIALTNDPAYRPTGEGPEESPVSGEPPPGSAPVIAIVAPADGAVFVLGEPVVFTGTATDAEDGDLSEILIWTSSIDGGLGGGSSMQISSLSAGTHTVTAAVTDTDGLSGLAAIDVIVSAAGVNQTFQQGADGILSMEAEHFATRIAASDRSWQIVDDAAASSDAAIQSLPDDARSVRTDVEGNSPRVDYLANIVVQGTHYAWFRTRGVSYASNSFHFGINGTVLAEVSVSPVGSEWVWVGRVPMRLSDAQFAFSVWMREDGTEIDKIVLTTDAGFTPSGIGPAESPRL